MFELHFIFSLKWDKQSNTFSEIEMKYKKRIATTLLFSTDEGLVIDENESHNPCSTIRFKLTFRCLTNQLPIVVFDGMTNVFNDPFHLS